MKNFSLNVAMTDNDGNVVSTKEAKEIRRNAVKGMLGNNTNYRIQYIRKHDLDKDGYSVYGRGRPIGVVLCKLQDNNLYVGWSLLHKNDKYDRDFGILAAASRMVPMNTLLNNKNIPDVVRNNVARVVSRSLCYFRGK